LVANCIVGQLGFCQARLLLSAERPDFVAFEVPQFQVDQLAIHHSLAGPADLEHEIHYRGPMDAGKPGDSPQAGPFDQQMENADLHFAGQNAH
jgi:hypothetical protein